MQELSLLRPGQPHVRPRITGGVRKKETSACFKLWHLPISGDWEIIISATSIRCRKCGGRRVSCTVERQPLVRKGPNQVSPTSDTGAELMMCCTFLHAKGCLQTHTATLLRSRDVGGIDPLCGSGMQRLKCMQPSRCPSCQSRLNSAIASVAEWLFDLCLSEAALWVIYCKQAAIFSTLWRL